MVDESKGEEYCYSGISEMALSLEKSKKSCEIGFVLKSLHTHVKMLIKMFVFFCFVCLILSRILMFTWSTKKDFSWMIHDCFFLTFYIMMVVHESLVEQFNCPMFFLNCQRNNVLQKNRLLGFPASFAYFNPFPTVWF